MMEEMVIFILFVLLQSVAINGVYESFQEGNLFYLIAPGFFKRNKEKNWAKPLYSCVRCMASVWGGVIFWSAALIIFGYDWREIPLYFFDVFILVTVNFFIYKKV